MELTLDSRPQSAAGWKRICSLDDIPVLGSRVVRTRHHGDIAVFRNADGEVFALHDRCPHKGGPLSQGVVHGRSVTCPLHAWKVKLDDGHAVEPDVGCTPSFEVKVDADGSVLLSL